MRFESITLENFGPFKDRETINFTSKDGITIVWGDNGRGKTTLLNAFNFVLLNTFKTRNGRNNDYYSFINIDGLHEGKVYFSVSLHVTDNGEDYRISRRVKALPSLFPSKNEDLESVLTVNHNGNIVNNEEANHIVKSIMAPEVSRFFLFDGELLKEYEELLDQSSPNLGSIKDSIEQILGVPILTNGATDSKIIADKISTEATKIAQNDENTKKYAQAIQKLEESNQTQKAEKARLEDERKKALVERDRLKNLAENTQSLREKLLKEKELETQIANLENNITQSKKEISTKLTKAYDWLVLPAIKKKLNIINNEIDSLTPKELETTIKNILVSYLSDLVQTQKCPVCNHVASNVEMVMIQQKLNEIESNERGLTSSESDRLAHNRTMKSILEDYLKNQDISEEIKQKISRINSDSINITNFRENELKALKIEIGKLKNGNSEDINALKVYEDLANIKATIVAYDEGIKQQQVIVNENDQNINKLRAKIVSISQNSDVRLAEKKVEFAKNIYSLFQKGVESYREKLKQEVEKDATDIFLKMCTEEDYACLKINDNYGLEIIRRTTKKAIPKRSAGWEHMVAFALIGALHKNAPFEGPVIMDSPFGRMSKKNTANMVKAIPYISKQILLLPLPGEIDEQSTRMDIGEHIIQEKSLVRKSAVYTKIEEYSDNA